MVVNIKMELKDMALLGVYWTELANEENSVNVAFVNVVMKLLIL